MDKKHKCNCCEKPRYYQDKRGLRKHQKQYDKDYVFGGDKFLHRHSYENNPVSCGECGTYLEYEKFKNGNRFCGHSCAAKYTKNRLGTSSKCSNREIIEAWYQNPEIGSLSTGSLRKVIRDHVLEKAGYKCCQCHWGERNPVNGRPMVQIDHKDGDWENNHHTNLRVLCPNCHSLTHTYCALNNGRGRRKKRQEEAYNRMLEKNNMTYHVYFTI